MTVVVTRSDQLIVERKEQDASSGVVAEGIMITPAIDEDYWSYRVLLSETQAVLGFPKFTTIGIGFAVEDGSWNTNLPYTSDTERIFNHILVNKGDERISDDIVREAIALIQEAVKEDRNKEA